MASNENYKIRPYARLLTMLGEQLIKNERIALVELIKNSYDADAGWVKVSFVDFGEDYKVTQDSKILIEDDGHGMTRDIIENHLLNPATPEKKRRKKINDRTKKGRVIQGEKGIGRFAMLKLGRAITITTRALSDLKEHIVEFDFSQYDDDFLMKNDEEADLFLEDLSVSIESAKPSHFVDRQVKLGTRKLEAPPHGTVLEISNLKGSWTEGKVTSVFEDLARLQPIFTHKKKKSDFIVFIYKDDERQSYDERYFEKLNFLLNERSVFRIKSGIFDADQLQFRYEENGQKRVLDLNDGANRNTRVFKNRFKCSISELKERALTCGTFHFGFYVFDRSSDAPAKYELDKTDKQLIKDHRVYLYRDGIRVYPYGDTNDDWLQVDVIRGTESAAAFLSNDQVVGFVDITQKQNPLLKDKTNREGLIEEGNTTGDFVAFIQTFLSYLRAKPYARYRANLKNKKDQDSFKKEKVQTGFDELKKVVGENKKAQALIVKAESSYKAERRYLTHRAETTEQLAGVGLSVETASHDIMGIIGRVFSNLDTLIQDLMSEADIDREELLKDLQSIRGGMSFMEAQLKDIQLLFASSKARRKNITVKEIVEKVERIYSKMLKKKGIKLSINSVGSPLVAKTTDAVLLQLLLNLFDNAVYWLSASSQEYPEIEVLLDGNKGKMVFSDNGPGVDQADVPYIFEPFYSGKGEEGRGLGLYIARQLLERSDYSIEVAELKSDTLLKGANFVINFVSEEVP